MKNVNSVFEEQCTHLVFDEVMLKKIMTYEHRFVTKNEAHISFFGGNLMGVDPVRFKPEDRNQWFNEILDAEEEALEEELHRLPDILSHRHVSSDVMNLSCFWVAHKFLTSSKLSKNDRELGAKLTILILQYKFITSILADWFRWNADPAVAQATYQALNKRFGLKVAGSWGVLLRQRAEAVMGESSIHRKTLMEFSNDEKIVYMVNDTQGRIKDILKNIRDVFSAVARSPELIIRNVGSQIELDGDLKIRDKTRMISTYQRYILETISDRNGFIIPDLVDIIAKLVNTMPKASLVATLTYMSNNASPKADKRVQALCEIILKHAFDYITRNPEVMASQNDIPGLLRKMKALYQASKTSDTMILEMRSMAEGIAKAATGSKNTALLAAIRNAVLLYVLLRTMTMHKFRGK